MSTVQMNIRIKKSTKKAGDATIKAAGYTPTKSVNLFWEYMANNKHDKEKVAKFYEELDPKKTTIEQDRYNDLLRLSNSGECFKKFCEENGLEYKPSNKPLDKRFYSSSNADIREIAYGERLAKYQ